MSDNLYPEITQVKSRADDALYAITSTAIAVRKDGIETAFRRCLVCEAKIERQGEILRKHRKYLKKARRLAENAGFEFVHRIDLTNH